MSESYDDKIFQYIHAFFMNLDCHVSFSLSTNHSNTSHVIGVDGLYNNIEIIIYP